MIASRNFRNDSAKGRKEADQIDFRITTKSGEKRWISHSCQSVFSDDGRWLGRRASNHDSSGRRKLMEELMKARELEAVGIIAGGISHDFNDLITAILGNVSIAKTHVEPDTKVYHLLTNAEEVAVRSHDLIQQLIAFSQRGKLLKKLIPISETIKSVVGFDGEIIFDNSKPDGTLRKLLDVERLHALGWRAKTGLEQGIRLAYADFQQSDVSESKLEDQLARVQ